MFPLAELQLPDSGGTSVNPNDVVGVDGHVLYSAYRFRRLRDRDRVTIRFAQARVAADLTRGSYPHIALVIFFQGSDPEDAWAICECRTLEFVFREVAQRRQNIQCAR